MCSYSHKTTTFGLALFISLFRIWKHKHTYEPLFPDWEISANHCARTRLSLETQGKTNTLCALYRCCRTRRATTESYGRSKGRRINMASPHYSELAAWREYRFHNRSLHCRHRERGRRNLFSIITASLRRCENSSFRFLLALGLFSYFFCCLQNDGRTSTQRRCGACKVIGTVRQRQGEGVTPKDIIKFTRRSVSLTFSPPSCMLI